MKKIWLIIFSVTLLLLFQADALACKCAKPTIENSFEKATVIFSGEVIKLDKFRAILKVEKVWKGKADKEIAMHTGMTKSAEGYYISSSCDFGYVLGEKYLIYAFGSDDELKTNVCSRTKSLEQGDEDIKELEKLKQEIEKSQNAAF